MSLSVQRFSSFFTLGTIICGFLMVCSCDSPNSEKKIYTVYNPKEYYDVIVRDSTAIINVIDTHCINEKVRAKKDLKEGKLFYYADSIDYGFSEKRLMLSKYGVELKHMSMGCGFGRLLEFDRSCYEHIIALEVIDRLGMDFIDSLFIEAERNFAYKNPDSIYIRDGNDLRKKYLTQ